MALNIDEFDVFDEMIEGVDYWGMIDQLDKVVIEAAMNMTLGNQTKAADALGISRGNLINKLKKHGML